MKKYNFTRYQYEVLEQLTDAESIVTLFNSQYATALTIESLTELSNLYYINMMESKDDDIKKISMSIMYFLEDEVKKKYKGAKKKYFLDHRYDIPYQS